jgi:hypothetical protein
MMLPAASIPSSGSRCAWIDAIWLLLVQAARLTRLAKPPQLAFALPLFQRMPRNSKRTSEPTGLLELLMFCTKTYGRVPVVASSWAVPAAPVLNVLPLVPLVRTRRCWPL